MTDIPLNFDKSHQSKTKDSILFMTLEILISNLKKNSEPIPLLKLNSQIHME